MNQYYNLRKQKNNKKVNLIYEKEDVNKNKMNLKVEK